MDGRIMATRKLKNHIQLASKQWDRYTSASERGHTTYQKQARLNEDFYLGGGRQWDDEVKAALESIGKPWLEENIIFSTINTVIGYQTQSRMDIAFKPREDGDQEISDIITKLGMFIVDQNKYPWVESQVFSDGLIQQRGYLDARIEFDDNMYGDIKITSLDPLDVIPDPDGKSYDPDDWQDVMTTRWMSVDDIKITYGAARYRDILRSLSSLDEPDFGEDGLGVERNRFGTTNTYNSYYKDKTGEEHVRVIERQWYKLQNREFWFDIETGEIFPIPDETKTAEKNRVAKETGREIITKLVKRVRWTVSTKTVVLHDDWSPYDHFTIVPYFPYFRRGVTIGLVDNLIKTQEMLNKTFSQILHVINTTANSGWIVEENSLTNMETEDLEDHGATTGLVIEHKPGRNPPEKIEPNEVPNGLQNMVSQAVELIQLISGVTETFKGGKGPEVSGVAIQSRVHQSAIQLAAPIDNLFRTRHLLADRLLKLIQQFYTEQRTFLVLDESTEQPTESSITINQVDDFGEMINDITVGKYDVVIADIPTQVTFQNAQFQQALEMRKYGVEIPDDEMVKMSTLARKNEIAKRMSGEANEEQQKQMQEQYELQVEELRKTIQKLQAEADKKSLETAKQAADIADMLSQNPSLAPIMDEILRENLESEQGFNAPEEAPIVPEEERVGGLGNLSQ
jgi:hypothetical protein